MSKVSPVNKMVEYGLRKPLKWVSETKLMQYSGKKFVDNKRLFIDALGVGSIVLKDGLGCYLYVKQSLNNKKIPDDKRKFVAALDLANGGLMIAMQLLMFFTVSHKIFQSKMFDKFFGKSLDRPIRKSIQALIKKRDLHKTMSGAEFNKEFLQIRDSVKDAFGALTSLAAATIVGKRVIVPFIATPLADKTKAWMSRNDKPVQIDPGTKNTYNTHPSMKGMQKGKNLDIISADTASTNLLSKYKQVS